MSDIQNPTDLSDYDWLEFVSFVWKCENEGFTYTYEEYSPGFEASAMQELAADMGKFRAYFRKHADLVETWAEAVGWEAAGDLHDAHVAESRKRRQP